MNAPDTALVGRGFCGVAVGGVVAGGCDCGACGRVSESDGEPVVGEGIGLGVFAGSGAGEGERERLPGLESTGRIGWRGGEGAEGENEAGKEGSRHENDSTEVYI